MPRTERSTATTEPPRTAHVCPYGHTAIHAQSSADHQRTMMPMLRNILSRGALARRHAFRVQRYLRRHNAQMPPCPSPIQRPSDETMPRGGARPSPRSATARQEKKALFLRRWRDVRAVARHARYACRQRANTSYRAIRLLNAVPPRRCPFTPTPRPLIAHGAVRFAEVPAELRRHAII